MSIFTTNILLTKTSIVNLTAAMEVLILGALILLRGQKSTSNRLVFSIAFFLSFWALSSTLSDVMHSPEPALFWARAAIIGPFFFAGLFLIFSYFFPPPVRRIGWVKILVIMLPCLVLLPLLGSPLNVVEIRLADWGTDFTPGPLYSVGILYLFTCLGIAARNFYVEYRKTKDVTVKKQITLVFFATGLVIVSLLLTNAILPIFFNYTKASVFGPASSLFFVILIGYAVLRQKLLEVKVIATEIFTFVLLYILLIQLLSADSLADLILRAITFVVTAGFGYLLVKSVAEEIKRREELQVLSKELEKANEHLKEMDQLKSEFISIASHQLRTPISVIKGYLSLMLEGAYGKQGEQFKEKIEHMFEMNERLVMMVNNMLNVTRIEKHRLEFMCAAADVSHVIEQAIDDMRLKAKQKGITIVFVDRPAEPLVAFVDKEKVHETVTNLIDNAIKYSVSGAVEVRAAPHRKEREVLVSIKDNGVGMTKDEAKRLFEKFFRASGSKISREQGTGLGLYVCKMFVEGMGGKIWIDKTEPGKGTTFAFALPTEPKQECAAPRKLPVVA